MKNRKKRTAILTTVGVVVLIVLLFMWLTDAMATGDTDVNAAPMLFLGNNVNLL